MKRNYDKRVLAKADDGTAELYIYKQIGAGLFTEGVTAEQIAAAVSECEKNGTKKLAIYVNSPGGDVFEGVAILNCLKRFSGEKTVYVDGMAASIASVIAMAGDRIEIGSGAMMMIHDPRALPTPYGVGTADQMREKAAMLDKVAEAMVAAYAERTDGDPATIRELMRVETWMTAADAIERGFADETFHQDEAANASAFAGSQIFASFLNVPEALRARAALPPPPAPPAPQPKETHVMFKALLAKLGLSESATEAQAVVAFDAMVGTSRKLIEITGSATESEALGRVAAWKSSHEKVEELTAKVQKIETERAQAEVKALVDGAIKDGKAAPAQRDALMTMSPEALKAFVAAAPVIHARSSTAPKPENDSVTLTPEEIAVCKNQNLDQKKFLEGKQKAIAEGRAPHPSMLQALAAPAV